ncbi:MAG TPA: DUF2269 family protein [Actinomycetota bacterium]
MKKGGVMELSEWLAFIHILTAMFWVGAGVVLNLATSRVAASGDDERVVQFTRNVEFLGNWLIGPSAVAVVGTGIWITAIEEWVAFSQLWIILALVGVAVSMLLGMGYFGPEGKRLGRLAEERGASDPELKTRTRRLLLLSRLDILVLVFLTWDMVFKPGLE